MSSILLEPILPNLTKVGATGDQLRDLWRLFTKVKDCTQGGRRLENLYWRLWYQSSSTGTSQESDKISTLFETWRGDGEDFKGAKSRSLDSTHHAEDGGVVTSSAAAPAAVATAAVPVTATSSSSASSVFAPPPPTPSIQISRVSSALKSMAAAAAEVAPPIGPAVPVTIHPKKTLTPGKGSHGSNITPSKVSVGFFSEVKLPAAQEMITTTTMITTAAPPTVSQGFQATSATSSSTAFTTLTFATTGRARASTADSSIKEVAGRNKKFFINSLSSVSSNESLDQLMSSNQPYPSAPVNSPANFTNPDTSFCKVTPAEPPDGLREKQQAASNLSSLLKAPRRNQARPTNILASGLHFSTRRQATDCAPQYPESESLRRGLQLDRKPLVDPSLVFGGASSFQDLPAAW